MTNEKVFQMDLKKVYDCLVAKATRKGRTREEVDAVTSWLTGYTPEEIAAKCEAGTPYGQFFLDSPHWNPASVLIKGSVCGIKVEEIEDPLMQKIRYLDKLVDELYKGKPLEKVLRSA